MLCYRPSERQNKAGDSSQMRIWPDAAGHARALRRTSENPAQGR